MMGTHALRELKIKNVKLKNWGRGKRRILKLRMLIYNGLNGAQGGNDELGMMNVEDSLRRDERGRGILWGNSNKPLEVIENKEYHCAHTVGKI